MEAPNIEVVWTDGARSDLYAVTQPLHDVSPQRAEAFLLKVAAAVQRLALFPESGRKTNIEPYDELNVREILVERHRLFYLYIADKFHIEVWAVFNARQDVAAKLKQRLQRDT
jgi:plasmid stabilization system protein ParE